MADVMDAALDTSVEQLKMCGRCKELLPIARFSAHKTTKDRKQYYCKTCCREQNQSVRHVAVPTVAEKKCRDCGVVKPAEDFPRNTQKKDGLHPACRACVRAFKQNRKTQAPTVAAQTCRRCGHTKPAVLFSINRTMKSGLNSVCKDCCRKDMQGKLEASGVSRKRPLRYGPGLEYRCPRKYRPRGPRRAGVSAEAADTRNESSYWARRLGTVVLVMLLIERAAARG